MKKLLKRIVAFAGALLLMAASCFGAYGVKPIYAYAATENAFDKTSVNDDLSDVDWLKYPYNPFGAPTLMNFVEYCYTDSASKNDDYALYLYVYNPAKLSFSLKGNVVNMAIAYDGDKPIDHADVDLITCGASTGDKAGLIYKFRVDIPEVVYTNAKVFQREYGYRQYDIVGVQLREIGVVETHDWKVGRTYQVSGYAKGMDASSEEKSTLSVTYSGLDVLELDVHPTYYRPEGNNGKNEYTQDSLHSVYFAVPKDKGEITAMSAEWLDAVLKPMLCTGNKDVYMEYEQYLGVDVVNSGVSLEYECATGFDAAEYLQSQKIKVHWYYGSTQANVPGFRVDNNIYADEQLRILYMLFAPQFWGMDSADDYIVPSSLIKKRMAQSYAKFGGEKIEGAEGDYSSLIFESIADQKTEMNFTLDSAFEMDSIVIEQTWWERLWGTSHVASSTRFDGIKAIQAVTDADVTGSQAVDCDKLFISTGDYDDFCDFYDKNKKDRTVYLLRYQVTDFVSQECHEFGPGIDLMGDTNAFFFQETANLGFDVINVTMEKDGVETVYGVVSDPLDVVHDGTPPLNTTSDFDWWGLILGFLLLALCIGLLLAFIPSLMIGLLKLVGWVLLLPFRALAKLWELFTGK